MTSVQILLCAFKQAVHHPVHMLGELSKIM